MGRAGGGGGGGGISEWRHGKHGSEQVNALSTVSLIVVVLLLLLLMAFTSNQLTQSLIRLHLESHYQSTMGRVCVCGGGLGGGAAPVMPFDVVVWCFDLQLLYEELKLDQQLPSSRKVTLTAIAHHKSTSEPMLRQMTAAHPLPAVILEYRHVLGTSSFAVFIHSYWLRLSGQSLILVYQSMTRVNFYCSLCLAGPVHSSVNWWPSLIMTPFAKTDK